MAEELLPPSSNRNKFSLSFDYRLVIVLLIGIVLAMTIMWKPWRGSSASSNDRTITVSGEAKITAEPDSYTFYPSYEFKDTDKAAALAALTKKSDELVAKLKTLGVADKDIKTGASGYNYQYYYEPSSHISTYTLQLTITANSRDEAQKVQDYLVSTTPTGAVSPQVDFSQARRKQLESQARDTATKEARAKADQSAKNLGFKIGSVKSVQDGAGFGNYPIYDKRISQGVSSSGTPAPQLSVQPGQNDLTYSVSVVYFLH